MYYINIFKKIFVNSVNMPLKQKVSVDYGTTPTMVFSLLDKCGKPFNIPTGAMFYIAGDTDYNQDTAPCFYSTDYSIDGNTITFDIETYTEEFLEKVKNPDTSLVIEIGMKLDDKSFVMLQDSIIAQPRVYIEGKPLPSVGEEFYTKGEVDNLLNTLEDATKTYVDEIADTIPDLADYTGDVGLKRQYNSMITLNTFQANENGAIDIGDGTKNVNQTISINTGAGAGVVMDGEIFTVTTKQFSDDQYPLYLSFGDAKGGHFYTGMNDFITDANSMAVYEFIMAKSGYRECHVASEINNVVAEHYKILFSNIGDATFSVDGSKRLTLGMQNSSTTDAYAIDAKVQGTDYTIAIGRNVDSPTTSFSGCTVKTYVRGTTITINSQNQLTISSGNAIVLNGGITNVRGNTVRIGPKNTATGVNFQIQNCNSFTYNGAGLNTAGGLVKVGDDGKIPLSADLSDYVGGVSITGESNGSTADVLNYRGNVNAGSITLGWNVPSWVAQPDLDTYRNNILVKGWQVGILGGMRVLLDAGGQTITVHKNNGISLDANNLSWNGNGLNTAGGLVKIGDDGKIPSDLIDVAGGSADLSNYVGGISITGEIENYENKPVLNYEVKSDVPTIKIGNTENVIPADGAGMNLEQKADDVKIIAGERVTLQAYKSGNSKNASIILSDYGRFDLASDVFSYYGNTFQIVAPNIFFNGVTLEALTEGNLSINNISGESSTVNIDFNSPAKFFKFDCYWTNISFYFYGTPSGSNACITKEFFICPMNGNDIHTISIPWNLQIVGEMPTVLQGRKEFVNEYGDVDTKPVCHVFVARAVWDATISNWTYTINYAYNYCYEI